MIVLYKNQGNNELRSYRYIFIFLFLLALCSLISCIVLALAGGSGVIITAQALTGLVVLTALAFHYRRTAASLDSIVDFLRNDPFGKAMPRTAKSLGPLAEALSQVIESASEKTGKIKNEHEDLALKLQLLGRQKKNIEAIIYSIRDAVIVTDAFDRLIIANSACEKLFDFDINAAQNKSIEEFINRQEFVKLILHSRRSRLEHVKHEITFTNGNETAIFDCIISCVNDDKGLVSGVVAVLHDMTREKEIAKAKNDFVGHVSHELKTPLASINAYAEMLADGEAEDQETINRFCFIIQDQAQRLNRLIEDILNISRIESGMTKINKQPVSLTILIQDAVKMIIGYAREKNITIDSQAPIVFDRTYADKDMISQVIVNLLSNAVKYTPQGGTVSTGTEVNEADRIVRVTISDTGVGIGAEELEHVFDKFYRVDANKKYAEGTGLGLNLVKQIVEKIHDGRVFVTSTPGKGSTFGFDLPLVVDAELETANSYVENKNV